LSGLTPERPQFLQAFTGLFSLDKQVSSPYTSSTKKQVLIKRNTRAEYQNRR
jgi:hypothetical protein